MHQKISMLFAPELDKDGALMVDNFTNSVVVTTYIQTKINLSIRCPLMDTIREMGRSIVHTASQVPDCNYKAYIQPSRFLRGLVGRMVVPAEITVDVPEFTGDLPVDKAEVLSAELFDAKVCQYPTPSQLWPSWLQETAPDTTLAVAFEKAVIKPASKKKVNTIKKVAEG